MTERELRRYRARGVAPVVCPETGRVLEAVALPELVVSRPLKRRLLWWPTSLGEEVES